MSKQAIVEKFRTAAVEAYNNINKDNNAKLKEFAELQEKLEKCTDVLCEDQYFGIVKIKRLVQCEWTKTPLFLKQGKFTKKDKKELNEQRIPLSNNISTQKGVTKTIVIVLESPHTGEFFEDENTWSAIGPACGTTGENLYKWLPEVLLNYVPCSVDPKDATATYNNIKEISDGEYKVFLINAIQFQCSLGKSTTEYRDAVFASMWSDDVKASFQERLERCSPNIIINCCTKGHNIKDENNELRRLVQEEINTYNKDKNALLLRAAHPSSLYFKNGLFCVDERKEQIQLKE